MSNHKKNKKPGGLKAMKKGYVAATLNVVYFATEDVVRTSGEDGYMDDPYATWSSEVFVGIGG